MKKLVNKKLNEEIKNLKFQLSSMKFDLKSGAITNLKEYKKVKLSLAQALTKKNAIELGIEKVEEDKVEKKSAPKVELNEKAKLKKANKDTKK